MEKLYVILFLFFQSFSLVYSQPVSMTIQDCCFAFPLTGPDLFQQIDVVGPGDTDDPIQDCSCADSPEIHSFWFRFDALEATFIEFLIKPLGPNSDYDFVLFEGGCPCGPSFFGPVTEVACDNTPWSTGGSEPTGLGNPAQWGFPGATQFQPGIFAEAGQSFYLVVNNVAPGIPSFTPNGFSIQFSATSAIGQLPKPGPPLTGPSELCPGSTGEFSTAGNPLFTINWTMDGFPIPVFGGPSSINVEFPDVGTYEICADIEVECNINFDPSCITVEVQPIPKTIISDIICYPPGTYDAPNGDIISAPGVHSFVFESFLGCDSIVEVTLEPKYGDLVVRTAIVCEGDCVDFEGRLSVIQMYTRKLTQTRKAVTARSSSTW